MNHPPIPISELAEHTELLKANDNLKLSQEYEVGGPTIQMWKLPYSVDFCPIVFSLGGEKDSSGMLYCRMLLLLNSFFSACFAYVRVVAGGTWAITVFTTSITYISSLHMAKKDLC